MSTSYPNSTNGVPSMPSSFSSAGPSYHPQYGGYPPMDQFQPFYPPTSNTSFNTSMNGPPQGGPHQGGPHQGGPHPGGPHPGGPHPGGGPHPPPHALHQPPQHLQHPQHPPQAQPPQHQHQMQQMNGSAKHQPTPNTSFNTSMNGPPQMTPYDNRGPPGYMGYPPRPQQSIPQPATSQHQPPPQQHQMQNTMMSPANGHSNMMGFPGPANSQMPSGPYPPPNDQYRMQPPMGGPMPPPQHHPPPQQQQLNHSLHAPQQPQHKPMMPQPMRIPSQQSLQPQQHQQQAQQQQQQMQQQQQHQMNVSSPMQSMRPPSNSQQPQQQYPPAAPGSMPPPMMPAPNSQLNMLQKPQNQHPMPSPSFAVPRDFTPVQSPRYAEKIPSPPRLDTPFTAVTHYDMPAAWTQLRDEFKRIHPSVDRYFMRSKQKLRLPYPAGKKHVEPKEPDTFGFMPGNFYYQQRFHRGLVPPQPPALNRSQSMQMSSTMSPSFPMHQPSTSGKPPAKKARSASEAVDGGSPYMNPMQHSMMPPKPNGMPMMRGYPDMDHHMHPHPSQQPPQQHAPPQQQPPMQPPMQPPQQMNAPHFNVPMHHQAPQTSQGRGRAQQMQQQHQQQQMQQHHQIQQQHQMQQQMQPPQQMHQMQPPQQMHQMQPPQQMQQMQPPQQPQQQQMQPPQQQQQMQPPQQNMQHRHPTLPQQQPPQSQAQAQQQPVPNMMMMNMNDGRYPPQNGHSMDHQPQHMPNHGPNNGPDPSLGMMRNEYPMPQLESICPACSRHVVPGATTLSCMYNECKNVYHKECTGLSSGAYSRLEIESGLARWVCLQCEPVMKQRETAFNNM